MITIETLASMDAGNRAAVFETITCDPIAGEIARVYLAKRWPPGIDDQATAADAAAMELMHWLAEAREACGVRGVGHA